MDGLTLKPTEKKAQNEPSPESSQSLKRWLGLLAETYKYKWNELSLSAYKFALGDLTPEEIELACKTILRTWSLATMPPPGAIRATLQLSSHDESYSGPPQLTYNDSASEEERLAALEDPAYQELKSKIHLVAGQKKLPANLGPETDYVVIADRARLEELDRQRKVVFEKYGKR